MTTLYQVHIMRYAHMDYGKYDVYLTPVFSPAWAELPGSKGINELKDGDVITGFPGLEAKSYTYVNAVENGAAEAIPAKSEDVTSFTSYIDTIRVYHPRGAMVHGMNIDAQEYYSEEAMNAKYVEVRNILLNGIDDIANDTDHGFNGAIFMDYGPTQDGGHINEAGFDPAEPSTFTAMAYALLGPNNEMYLPATGSFTFNLANPTSVVNLHLSAKALGSDEAEMRITYQYGSGAPVTIARPVYSATEMYYDIGTEGGDRLINEDLVGITVECISGTLSLLNLKIVYEGAISRKTRTHRFRISTSLATSSPLRRQMLLHSVSRAMLTLTAASI